MGDRPPPGGPEAALLCGGDLMLGRLSERLQASSPRGTVRGQEVGVGRHLSECTAAIVSSARAPVEGGGVKVHYVLKFTDSCGFTWDVTRRFSAFVTLRENLEAAGASGLKDGGKVPFPRKTAGKASDTRQSGREAALTKWINTVLNVYASDHTHQLQEFVEYPGLVKALRQRKHCVHQAVELQAGADDIAKLLEEEDACRMPSGDGPSTLHVACQGSGFDSSDVVLRLLIKNPDGREEQGLSHKAISHPIHEAAQLMLKKELVHQLVKLFPDEAHEEVDGALPLHVALEQGDRIDWAVVGELLRANPDAAAKTGPAASGQRALADASGLPLHRALANQGNPTIPTSKEAKEELMRLLIIANPEAALQEVPGNPFPAGWLDEPVAEGVFAQAVRRDKKSAGREWGEVVKTNDNGCVVLKWASDDKLAGEQWYGELAPVFKDKAAQKTAEREGRQISNPLFNAVRAFRRAALLTKVPAFLKRGVPAGQEEAHRQKINDAVAEAIELARRANLPVLHLAIALCIDVPECVQHFLSAEEKIHEPIHPCDKEQDFRKWLPVHRLVTTVGMSATSDEKIKALIKEIVHKTAKKHTHHEEVMFGIPHREQTTLVHWSVEHSTAPIAMIFLEQEGLGADPEAVQAARQTAGVDDTEKADRLEHTASAKSKDSKGRTVVELSKAGDERLKRWAFTHQACLKRYTDTKYMDRLEVKNVMHSSRTAVTQFAYDQLLQEKVVLKWMRDRTSVLLELNSRNTDGLSTGSIIPVRRWHTAGERLTITRANGQEEKEQFESTEDRPPARKDHPYLLVLVAGERNAYDACANENLAGNDLDGVVTLMRDVVRCVHDLHSVQIVHGDIKTRNILRHDDRWTLCDMDASAHVGSPIGFKTSTGYAPPELAVRILQGGVPGSAGETLAAQPSFDIWSLGVVFYELCAGQPLFSFDTGNDELIKSADKNRLCVWNTISDEELGPVFASENIPEHTRNAAMHLLRWCLKGNPAARPTTEQVLDHPFLQGTEVPVGDDLPMKYHVFISHSQSDASGIANALFMSYDQLGVRAWLDMRQRDLTLEGMRQGVIDSDVFLLILSEHTLERWFCIQELLCAIEHEKMIQIVLEVESRFNPFNLAAWDQSKTADVPEKRMTKVSTFRNDKNTWQAERTDEQLAEMVCAAIDDSLPDAVTYRRRDFEAEAMMKELCRRNALVLPSAAVSSSASRPFKLSLICNRDTAEMMYSSITSGMQDWSHVQLLEGTVASTAGRVLLLLSPGVLKRGSPTLGQLLDVMQEMDASTSSQALLRYRIVMVYDPTWTFGSGNAELRAAPLEVQSCIQDHEAIAFRPQGLPSAPDRHEFGTMMRHLQVKLEEVPHVTQQRAVSAGLASETASAASSASVARMQQPEPELSKAPGHGATLETELREVKAQLVRKDEEIATLRRKLSQAGVSDEGVPPLQQEPEPEPGK